MNLQEHLFPSPVGVISRLLNRYMIAISTIKSANKNLLYYRKTA
ncbi:hypothetical protein [Terrimonas ginsenosidimutans]|nr:hypothetical protein [Terrimonas ginsenosidimutans]